VDDANSSTQVLSRGFLMQQISSRFARDKQSNREQHQPSREWDLGCSCERWVLQASTRVILREASGQAAYLVLSSSDERLDEQLSSLSNHQWCLESTLSLIFCCPVLSILSRLRKCWLDSEAGCVYLADLAVFRSQN
jgi:hypothetical protein